jgi:hypothetical protein
MGLARDFSSRQVLLWNRPEGKGVASWLERTV